MIKIAHRGNTNGPSIHENQPLYLLQAIDRGYDVEVDVRYISGHLWLGHDAAQYLLNDETLAKLLGNGWFHCKNLEALEFFAQRPWLNANYFWHESDQYTVTSQGYIWAYPEMPGGPNTVVLSIDSLPIMDLEVHGVCSDYLDSQY